VEELLLSSLVFSSFGSQQVGAAASSLQQLVENNELQLPYLQQLGDQTEFKLPDPVAL
jgi:hypothetical protein